MAAAISLKLVIPSEIRLVDLVHSTSEKMAEFTGFAAEEALNVGLAVREAVINAIIHGNRLDPARKVEVRIVAGRRGLRATVQDRGAGFDPGQAPDPTSRENLLRTSGRGLLLIRAFVDDVAFRYREGRGMEVTLVKKIRPRRRGKADRPAGPPRSGRTAT